MTLAGALSLSVPERIEETIAVLGVSEREQLRLLLRLLENPALMLLLARDPRRFSALTVEVRETVLRRMSVSILPQLRSGFQALYRLAAFHTYSTMPDGNDNPLWEVISYKPAAVAPAARSAVRLERVINEATIECDVCVVGAGAGGCVIASEMAGRGKRVVVLEAGSDWQSEDFDQREAPGTRELYLDGGTTTTPDLSVAFLAGSSVGGGTTVNWQSCFRTPPAILAEWAERSGCAHLAEEGFQRSLDFIWERLRVSDDESLVNPNNSILERGCAALGYHAERIARNSFGCDVAQCGNCVYGCRHGGKQSAAVTFLRDAQQTGKVSVLARCRADKILSENRRVTGIAATASDPISKEPRSVRVRCGTVVVACGALHSPALLMRSGVESPHLGRHLSIHPTAAMTGLFSGPIDAWSGPPQTVVCDEFANLRGNFGYRLETAPVHPGLLAMATPWKAGRQHRAMMTQAARRGVLIILVRDEAAGRVTIDGEGKPRIRYRPGTSERDLIRHGMVAASRILAAAGAEQIQSLHTDPHVVDLAAADETGSRAAIEKFCETIGSSSMGANRLQLFSAHQMGTCRMGRDPSHAVCAGDGGVFGMRGLYVGDASAFPASSGVNPMVTIMAMAHQIAQRIDRW